MSHESPSGNDKRLLDDEEHLEEEHDDAAIGVAFRRSLAVLSLLAIAGGATWYWYSRPKPAPPVKETELFLPAVRERPPLEIPAMPLTVITKEAGIDFVHENGAFGQKLLPETMGGG